MLKHLMFSQVVGGNTNIGITDRKIFNCQFPQGTYSAEKRIAVTGCLFSHVDSATHKRSDHRGNRSVLKVNVDLAIAEHDMRGVDGTTCRKDTPRSGIELRFVHAIPRII